MARPALNPIATTRMSSERPSTGMAILKVALRGAMDGFMAPRTATLAPVRKEGWKEVKIGCLCGFDRTGEVEIRKPGKEPIEVVHAFDQSFVMHLGGPEGFTPGSRGSVSSWPPKFKRGTGRRPQIDQFWAKVALRGAMVRFGSGILPIMTIPKVALRGAMLHMK